MDVTYIERIVGRAYCLPERPSRKEIIAGNLGIVVMVSRCAEHRTVKSLDIIKIICQIVIVRLPVGIPGKVPQGNAVDRNIFRLTPGQIISHLHHESALELAPVADPVNKMRIGENYDSMSCVVSRIKIEITLFGHFRRLFQICKELRYCPGHLHFIA